MDDFKIMKVSPSLDIPLEDTEKIAQKGLYLFAWAAIATGKQFSAEKKKWYIMDFQWDP